MIQNMMRNDAVQLRQMRSVRLHPSAIVSGRRNCGIAENTHRKLSLSVGAALKRRYKRDYMRRWRRDPRNVAQEAAARKRDYYERKCRRVLQALGAGASEPRAPLCGFCGHRASICEIERLAIGTDPKCSFTRVLVPYCGNC